MMQIRVDTAPVALRVKPRGEHSIKKPDFHRLSLPMKVQTRFRVTPGLAMD
jgi:hypothetical protein